ncbi:hypothetical protein PRK78_005515 [Emydomyces testavorans]|uniref:Uncharacterized protein n=1 Tax=Emydomyces testavorans TaxID=2070801 RepID=A0AAF0DJX2_9EURO|nr:hypothetical protein PRK78_005515 [Emydomyces testavorans]
MSTAYTSVHSRCLLVTLTALSSINWDKADMACMLKTIRRHSIRLIEDRPSERKEAGSICTINTVSYPPKMMEFSSQTKHKNHPEENKAQNDTTRNNLDRQKRLSNMCQLLMETIIYLCGCKLDKMGSKVAYENCGNCGIVVHTEHLGKSCKRDPCEDCIAARKWIKVNGKWQPAS